jgi:hypothetical protein
MGFFFEENVHQIKYNQAHRFETFEAPADEKFQIPRLWGFFEEDIHQIGVSKR